MITARKKVLCILLALYVCAGCAAALAEETPAGAKVSGQMVDGQGHYLMCMVLVENTADQARSVHWTDLSGRFSVELPKGNYLLTVQRGGCYEKLEIPLTIKSRVPKAFGEIQLQRLVDLPGRGWYAGDLHQHTVFSDGQDTPLALLMADLAGGLDFAAVTDHNSTRGWPEFTLLPGLTQAGSPFLSLSGVEVTSKDKGHFNVINTQQVYPFKFADTQAFGASVRQAKAAHTFVQMNHPSRLDILGMAYWDQIGLFDGMEVWNGKDLPPLYATNLLAKQKWFELLNAGMKLCATASSDVHSARGQAVPAGADALTQAWYRRGLFTGMPRTVVHMQAPSVASLIASLKQGQAFLTNGPVVLATIDGQSYGQSVNPGSKTLAVELWNNEPLTMLRLIKNGQTQQEFPLQGMVVTQEVNIALAAGDWVVLEIEADNMGYALTNPIWCQ